MDGLNWMRQRESRPCEWESHFRPHLGGAPAPAPPAPGPPVPAPAAPAPPAVLGGVQAQDECWAQGLVSAKQQPLEGDAGCGQALCWAFCGLLCLSWEGEECGPRALGNQEADKAWAGWRRSKVHSSPLHLYPEDVCDKSAVPRNVPEDSKASFSHLVQ